MDADFAAGPWTARNRPALDRVDYSLDDAASLRERLLARLPVALPGWNERLAEGGDDYAVVLVDLFAQLATVLNAYADHRVNEGFIRTATLPRSLIDLCELIDYRVGDGASAMSLQAFLAKPGKSGLLQAGFQLNATPLPVSEDRADLVFETQADLAVDAARNVLYLVGHDRSGRLLALRADTDAVQDVQATLDGVYAGLRAGSPLVLDAGTSLHAAVLVASTEELGATRVRWAPGGFGGNADIPIADLRILGRPRQAMSLAAAERADEITVGQNTLPVVNAAMFTVGSAVLVESGGLMLPVTVLAKDPTARTLTISRGVPSSLRRSATRVLEGTACGATTAKVRAGTTELTRDPTAKKKDFPHTPAPGDLLLVADANGVEMATVSHAAGARIVLAQPLPRAMTPIQRDFDDAARVRYYCIAPANPATHQTAMRPLLLGEVAGALQGSRTVLRLDKAYEGLAPQVLVALGDGLQTAAFLVAQADSEEGRTVLTLDGAASAALRVSTLRVFGPFEHVMHVAGYNRSEAVLPAGTSQLDLVGAPPGLMPGQDLVLADGTHAEGMRIGQVSRLSDRTRIALARGLEHDYALGDTRIHGNVVAIAHGAAQPEEVLGSGDPAAAPQRFRLRKGVLAFLPDAASPRGVSPVVDIRVGGERWTIVSTLAESGPLDHHCVIEIDERERASVVFGDGVHGAAPASGRDNITARYRTGHGAAANVGAGQIARMPRAAEFLQGAFNPVPASGGADREAPASIKRQAGFRIRTLDRAVSLQDHAELALSLAGIAKARADLEREGQGASGRSVIVVTCAAVGGHPLTLQQKEAALAFLASRSVQPARLRVRDFRPWPIRLALQVQVLPQHEQSAVQRALVARFGGGAPGHAGFFDFEHRALGGDLYLSEVYAHAESTPGVDNVLATAFHREGEPAQVADRIVVPADALVTGGDAVDPGHGRLTLHLAGGLT